MEGFSCARCASQGCLALCEICSVLLCATHIREHIFADFHFAVSLCISVTETVIVKCVLCRKKDVRGLVVTEIGAGEAVIMCKRGCGIVIKGYSLPGKDARSIVEAEKITEFCFARKIVGKLGALEVNFSTNRERETQAITPSIDNSYQLRNSDIPLSSQSESQIDCNPQARIGSVSTRSSPRKNSKRKRKENQQKKPLIVGDFVPVDVFQLQIPMNTPNGISETVSNQSQTQELIQTCNEIPNVFEDEEQYCAIFTDILGLETKEKRRQMTHIRTKAPIRWLYLLNKGEVTLASTEELEYDDDIKISDEYGNFGIFAVSEVNSASNFVKFKGDIDVLQIDQIDISEMDDTQEYTVEYWDSGAIKRMRRGLQMFFLGKTTQKAADWILGQAIPALDSTQLELFQPEGVSLNRYQKDAILFALANDLALIQGPPGTGKTATAAVIVYNIAMRSDERILVCAPSNIAVDQITLKIAGFAKEKVIRIYGDQRIKQGGVLPAEDFSLHWKVRLHFKRKYPETGDQFLDKSQDVGTILEHVLTKQHLAKPQQSPLNLSETAKDQLVSAEFKIVQRHSIVCCTCAMSMSEKIKNVRYLLMDEAGFSAEPETLLPLLQRPEHVIMVGDHMQLPPVVMSRVARARRYGRSMFERLIDLGASTHMLQIQYRMHPCLSAYPSREFYASKLHDGVTATDRILPQLTDFWHDSKIPMRLVNATGVESKYGISHSYCNESEAEIVESILYDLLQIGVAPDSIGVITPYDGQRCYLTEFITEKGRCDLSHIEIKNVDGFQGREKDLIVISCVRSNSEAEMGFLIESRRLNVAITRAKFGLIMIGNVSVLRTDQVWKGLIEEFSRNHCIVSPNPGLQHSYP